MIKEAVINVSRPIPAQPESFLARHAKLRHMTDGTSIDRLSTISTLSDLG
jgi:hypothetical protein